MDQIQKLVPHMNAEQENVEPEGESKTPKDEDITDAEFEVVDNEETAEKAEKAKSTE